MKPKQLTKKAVLKTASRLIATNNQTTTLEVKESLRKEGYRAIQDDISVHMMTLQAEENWQMGDNGTHRIYSNGQASSNLTPKTSKASTTSTSAKKENPLPSPVAGCWEANTVVSGHSPMYFDASLNRDKVRSLYAKLTNTSRNDARARQYKK